MNTETSKLSETSRRELLDYQSDPMKGFGKLTTDGIFNLSTNLIPNIFYANTETPAFPTPALRHHQGWMKTIFSSSVICFQD